jgi:hypothetical protein
LHQADVHLLERAPAAACWIEGHREPITLG